ncbi:MAG: hypothetical protein Q4Q07_06905 [Tissierellia bacterium]|nr:hypothetical protein [Tissierellia bacterium]
MRFQEYTILLPVIFGLFVMIIPLLIGIWTYKDAKRYGENPILWALIVIFVPNFIGLILYFLMVRRNPKVECEHCHSFTSGQKPYCTNCGEKIKPVPKENNTIIVFVLIILGILVITLVFGLIGFLNYTTMDIINGRERPLPEFQKAVKLMVEEKPNKYNLTFGFLDGRKDFQIPKHNIKKDALEVHSSWNQGDVRLYIKESDSGEKELPLSKDGITKISVEELPKDEKIKLQVEGMEAKTGIITIEY